MYHLLTGAKPNSLPINTILCFPELSSDKCAALREYDGAILDRESMDPDEFQRLWDQKLLNKGKAMPS